MIAFDKIILNGMLLLFFIVTLFENYCRKLDDNMFQMEPFFLNTFYNLEKKNGHAYLTFLICYSRYCLGNCSFQLNSTPKCVPKQFILRKSPNVEVEWTHFQTIQTSGMVDRSADDSLNNVPPESDQRDARNMDTRPILLETLVLTKGLAELLSQLSPKLTKNSSTTIAVDCYCCSEILKEKMTMMP